MINWLYFAHSLFIDEYVYSINNINLSWFKTGRKSNTFTLCSVLSVLVFCSVRTKFSSVKVIVKKNCKSLLPANLCAQYNLANLITIVYFMKVRNTRISKAVNLPDMEEQLLVDFCQQIGQNFYF